MGARCGLCPGLCCLVTPGLALFAEAIEVTHRGQMHCVQTNLTEVQVIAFQKYRQYSSISCFKSPISSFSWWKGGFYYYGGTLIVNLKPCYAWTSTLKPIHLGYVFGRKTTCSTLYLVLEADSKNWNNDRQKWLNQNELKEFSPGWSSVLKKLLPHTFAPPQTTLFIVHRCFKRQSCNMHLIEIFQLCWSCPTCAVPANVPRSGSARQPASFGFCVTRGL